MSLNGLEAENINAAYQAVLGQPGGWFLLRYLSRDEVHLFKEGTGGFAQAKDAVSEYEDKSPLYGLTEYKGRKVLLKYMPDGTSRLLQAIIERFPHDAILHFINPSELNKSTLSSLLSLPTATASMRSSDDSLRQRYLGKVAKEPGEIHEQSTTTFSNQAAAVSSQPRNESDSSVVAFNADALCLEDRTCTSTAYRDFDTILPPIPSDATSTIAKEFDDRPLGGRLSTERRPSSQSARPLTEDSDGGYGYRPRVKLGPRPSLDYDSRPNTTASRFHRSDSRPVAVLPAGVRMTSRKPVPVAHQVQSVPKHIESSNCSALPAVLSSSTPHLKKPAPKAGNTASMPSFTPPSESKQRSTTLERQRLMKALQMRQRQMAKRISEDNHSKLPEPTVEEDLNGKSADDESVLVVMGDTPLAEDESDIMHLVTKDLEDMSDVHFKASPISIPEPSEGPSTQTSSIADAEEPNVDESSSPNIVTHGPVDYTQELASPHVEIADIPVLPDQKPVNKEFDLASDTGRLISELKTSPEAVPHDHPSSPVDEDTELIFNPPHEDKQEHPESPTSILVCETNHLCAKPRFLSHLTDEDGQVPRIRQSTADTTELNITDYHNRKRGMIDPIRVVTNTEHSDDIFLSDDSFMEELQSATVQEAKPMSVSRSPITPVFPKPPRSVSEASKLSQTASHPQAEIRDQEKALLSPDRTTYSSHDQNLSHEQDRLRLGQKDFSSPDDDVVQDHSILIPKTAPLNPHQNGVRGLPKAFASSRATSNPLDSQPLHLEIQISPRATKSASRRSLSISPTPKGKLENTPAPLSKKLGVSTGISQRIKALEKFTASADSQSSPLASPVVSPSFVSSRKTSIGTSPVASIIPVGNGWSFRRRFPYPTPSPSPNTNTFDQGSSFQTTPGSSASTRTSPTSVTVTARIIRDVPDQNPGIPLDPSEPVPTNLHHSPLIVEHQSSAQGSMLSPTKLKKPRPSSVASNLSTSGDPKREALVGMRRESYASGRSTSSRRGSDANAGATLSDESSNGVDGSEGSKEEKRESKRNRLFRRMSSMSSASRRSIVHALSPTVKEEEPTTRRKQGNISETLPSTVYIGDVNIQFPDTL
ncbi:MAG: hypothetical protein Q9187_003738, partial [Circinaria calcarea]